MSHESPTLCNDLKVILSEAALRSNALDAAVVVSGALKALSDAYPELSEIAANWNELTSADLACSRRLPADSTAASAEGKQK